MPSKKGTKKRSSFQETEAKSCESNKISKTTHACTVDAHESTTQRLESSPPKDHEDHTAGKGKKSMKQYNLVHKFILLPQAMKIPDAKAVADKEWKKLETIPAWHLDNVKGKKEVARGKGVAPASAAPCKSATTVFAMMRQALLASVSSPKASLQQAAADPRGSRTCVCENTSVLGWYTQGRKGESRRPAVVPSSRHTSSETQDGRAWLPARVSGQHVVRGRQSSPTLEVRLGEQARLVKTVNIQVRWVVTLDKTVGSRVW